jgi:acyl-coenzyme A thioesterase PaaI-like protein
LGDTPNATDEMSETATPTRQRPHFAVPFNDHARICFLVSEPGHGIATIPSDPVLTNHLGTVHGGALFTVSEAASGRALMGAVMEFARAAGWSADELRMVTRTAHINFLKPAKGQIVARARVQTDAPTWQVALAERGRAVIDVEVDTQDDAGIRVAELQVEWHVSRRSHRDSDAA